ncbi:melanocyte-stimulating hormone receptor-like [Clytia hemisphaerica]|uniref:G-protein coupled receptors family 1 profile domain-containing protein n=1 Tax=Clytia hemisphaerica TaxID=252671 RepID=A0A7M5WRI1_9CNID
MSDIGSTEITDYDNQLSLPYKNFTRLEEFNQPVEIDQWTQYILWPVAVFIAFETILLLSVIYRSKKLRTPSNILVFSLLVSDFFNGSVLLPMILVLGLVHPFINPAIMFVLSSSFLNVMACSLDRFLGVRFALSYQNFVTNHRLKLALVVIWLSSTILCTLPKIMGPRYENTFHFRRIYISAIIISIILMIVVVICIYVYIFMEITRQLKFITGNHVENITDKQPRNGHRKNLKENFRSAATILSLTLNFFVCWFPLIYINLMADVVGRPDLVPSFLLDMSLHTIFLSSLMNPLLYGYRQRTVRKTLRNLVLSTSPKKERSFDNTAPKRVSV